MTIAADTLTWQDESLDEGPDDETLDDIAGDEPEPSLLPRRADSAGPQA